MNFMGEPAPRRATYRDLEKVPDHMVAEILNGELVASPRPAAPHAVAASAIGSELFGRFHRGRGGPGGWVILDEPELHLGEDVIVPDLGGWRRERLPLVEDVAAFVVATDFVCEVLSPSTEARDRAVKMPIYARERVAHVWLVQPAQRTLEVYRLDGPSYRLLRTFVGDEPARIEPFDEVEIDLGALWAR
jgi:Uma2 family endonuclease